MLAVKGLGFFGLLGDLSTLISLTLFLSSVVAEDYSLSRAGLNLQSSPTNMQSRPTFLLYMKIFYDNSLYVEQA